MATLDKRAERERKEAAREKQRARDKELAVERAEKALFTDAATDVIAHVLKARTIHYQAYPKPRGMPKDVYRAACLNKAKQDLEGFLLLGTFSMETKNGSGNEGD